MKPIIEVKSARTLWFLTAICIYAASFTGRFIQKAFPSLVDLIPLVGAILFLALFYYLKQKKLTRSALIILAVLALGALISESFIQMAIERSHYYKYSLLGIFSFLSISSKSPAKTIMIALFAAALIGIVEETAQLGIPNRYFDWRDIGINLFSAAFGVMAAYAGSRFAPKTPQPLSSSNLK